MHGHVAQHVNMSLNGSPSILSFQATAHAAMCHTYPSVMSRSIRFRTFARADEVNVHWANIGGLADTKELLREFTVTPKNNPRI